MGVISLKLGNPATKSRKPQKGSNALSLLVKTRRLEAEPNVQLSCFLPW